MKALILFSVLISLNTNTFKDKIKSLKKDLTNNSTKQWILFDAPEYLGEKCDDNHIRLTFSLQGQKGKLDTCVNNKYARYSFTWNIQKKEDYLLEMFYSNGEKAIYQIQIIDEPKIKYLRLTQKSSSKIKPNIELKFK